MRHDLRLLNVPNNGANGTMLDVRELQNAVIVVTAPAGTSAFDLKVQGKFSGPDNLANSEWFDLDASVNAAQIIPLQDASGYALPFTHVRLVGTTVGATKPIVYVAGWNHETG